MADEPTTEIVPPDQGCTIPPPGWWCSRSPGHDGPCAARPSRDDDWRVQLDLANERRRQAVAPLTDAEQIAGLIHRKMCTEAVDGCDGACDRVAARVADAIAAARADARQRLIAQALAVSPDVGFGMGHDGIEDPQAAAYVEGWRDALAALAQPADHNCSTCQECIHHESGVGCCGCYDGVCCVAQPADADAGNAGGGVVL